MDHPEVKTVSRARGSALPWLLFVVALAVAAWALWRAFAPVPLGDPLATTLTAFEKQNRLTVFSAQLSPVVANDEEQMFGLIKSRQVAVIPARVDYTIDLSAMGGDRLSWNAETKRMDVRLPALTLSRPNPDEGRAQYLREGVWITRTTQARLTRRRQGRHPAEPVDPSAGRGLRRRYRSGAFRRRGRAELNPLSRVQR
jgi:hypothetical protein